MTSLESNIKSKGMIGLGILELLYLLLSPPESGICPIATKSPVYRLATLAAEDLARWHSTGFP